MIELVTSPGGNRRYARFVFVFVFVFVAHAFAAVTTAWFGIRLAVALPVVPGNAPDVAHEHVVRALVASVTVFLVAFLAGVSWGAARGRRWALVAACALPAWTAGLGLGSVVFSTASLLAVLLSSLVCLAPSAVALDCLGGRWRWSGAAVACLFGVAGAISRWGFR